jgi:hypothetical protein
LINNGKGLWKVMEDQLQIGEVLKEVLIGREQTVMPAKYNIPKPEPAHCRRQGDSLNVIS